MLMHRVKIWTSFILRAHFIGKCIKSFYKTVYHIIQYTLMKESYLDVENPDQLRDLAFSTLP